MTVQTVYFSFFALLGAWVIVDAHCRRCNALGWTIGTLLFGPIVIPVYLSKRPLRAGEIREGGVPWNILRYFALLWTALMMAVGISAALALWGVNSQSTSDSQNAVAVITGYVAQAAVFGVLAAIWFFPMAGALVLGYFLRRVSVVERGPTGAHVEAIADRKIRPSSMIAGLMVLLVMGLIVANKLQHSWSPVKSPGAKTADPQQLSPDLKGAVQAVSADSATAYADSIDLKVTECKYITFIGDVRKPTIRFSVKNKGTRTVTRLGVVVYYLDEHNTAIGEKEFLLFAPDDYSDKGPLRPQYSLKCPSSADDYLSASQITSEWKEGAVRIVITDITCE